MPAAIISIDAKRSSGPIDANERRASWVIFEIARSGAHSAPYGILLADEETDGLTFRLQDPSAFDELDEQESDILDALPEDLRQKGKEMGGLRLLDWFEDSLSNFFRVGDRNAIVYSGDARATVDRLFHEIVVSREIDSVIRPFVTHLPVYNLRAAATKFGESMDSRQEEYDAAQWVRAPENLRLSAGMFVAYVQGRSMEPRIPDGSACIFRAPVTGSRNGRLLLIEKSGETDFSSRYTVKRYARQGSLVESAQRESAIRLEPLNKEFPAFDLTADEIPRDRRIRASPSAGLTLPEALPQTSLNRTGFRRALLRWYDASRRDLPWRESNDFYRVWISEVMLQQTRVEAVIPYYRRFLERFPSVESLATAPEEAVLTAWSGLGYYSRARNLHRAAQQLAAGNLPATHAEVLALPGAGPYTAAAVASIALNLRHAAVDGNVIRVISRLTNDASEIASVAARREFRNEAEALLDPRRPGDFNQAMMELGATICLPRTPACGVCPVERFCAARAAGTERELPVKLKKQNARDVPLDLALIEAERRIFLIKRPASERRLADFWELPGTHHVPELQTRLDPERLLGEFSHRIVNDRFRIRLFRVDLFRDFSLPPGDWFGVSELHKIPLTTITKKALATANIPRPNRDI